MEDYKRGSHTVWDCKYHLVWTTKYRYEVLAGRRWSDDAGSCFAKFLVARRWLSTPDRSIGIMFIC